MLDSTIDDDRAGLAERLRNAPTVTTTLLREVMNQTDRRAARPGDREGSARIERLIAAGAGADTALALIDLALPNWRLRRLAYDGGEWQCALSRQRELPDWLDQAAEASHADLTLAILGAFMEAQHLSMRPTRTSVPSVPLEVESLSVAVCCDHFA